MKKVRFVACKHMQETVELASAISETLAHLNTKAADTETISDYPLSYLHITGAEISLLWFSFTILFYLPTRYGTVCYKRFSCALVRV